MEILDNNRLTLALTMESGDDPKVLEPKYHLSTIVIRDYLNRQARAHTDMCIVIYEARTSHTINIVRKMSIFLPVQKLFGLSL